MTMMLPALVVYAVFSTTLSGPETAEFSCTLIELKDRAVFSVKARADFSEGDVEDRRVNVALSASRADLPNVRVDEGQMHFGDFPLLTSANVPNKVEYDFVEFSNRGGKRPSVTPIVVRTTVNGISSPIAGGLCEVNWKASEK